MLLALRIKRTIYAKFKSSSFSSSKKDIEDCRFFKYMVLGSANFKVSLNGESRNLLDIEFQS
jgi:hypothetical protein